MRWVILYTFLNPINIPLKYKSTFRSVAIIPHRRLIGRRYTYGASLDQREYREVERTLKSHCLPECLATEASHSGSVIDCLANSLSNTPNVFKTETVNF